MKTAYEFFCYINTVAENFVDEINGGVSYTLIYSYWKLCLECLLVFYFIIGI